MSRLKKISHILVAVLLASAAGGIVWYYVKINTPSVKVVVAAARLPIGTVVGPQHVVLKDFPESVMPKDAEISMQNVIGRTVVSGTVFEGEVIRRGHIAEDTGSLKAVLDSLAPGREAVDLPVETAPGLKGVAVGDRVNVYTEIAVQAGKEAATIVDCVAREAVILATPATTVSEKPNSLASAMDKGSYIVAVIPEESKKVAEGKVRGKKFSFSFLPRGGQ
ncbi:MAG: SAF domain-containing protein [Bacillota bacterium]